MRQKLIHSDPITDIRSQKFIRQLRNSRLLVESINHILGTVWRNTTVDFRHSILNYWLVNIIQPYYRVKIYSTPVNVMQKYVKSKVMRCVEKQKVQIKMHKKYITYMIFRNTKTLSTLTAIIFKTNVVVQSQNMQKRHQFPKIQRPNNWQCAAETYTQRPNNWYQGPEIYTSPPKLQFTQQADKSHSGHSMTSYHCEF